MNVEQGGTKEVALDAGAAIIGQVKLTDGTDVADVLDLGTYAGVGTYILDGSGNPITSFGGGTQYTDGDVDSTPTGTVAMWEDAGGVITPATATTPLPVTVISGGTAGTQYTEDAAAPANPVGTNLNMVRADVLAGLVTTDGDNVSARGTDKGELYVKPVDSIPVTATNLDILDLTSASDSVSAVVTSSALPTGASTSAKQDTIIGHLDGVEGLLTTIDADTSTLAAVDYATGTDVASLAVVGGGVEATALRVTIANDSTGVVSVDDNGGSITVDGSVTVSATNLDIRDLTSVSDSVSAVVTSSALPTGAATSAKQDTIIGHLDGVETLLGTIDADTSTLAAIDYATGADVASLAVVGGGLEATALRVTIANDSTGVVSVDDNGGSLTVDGSVTANAGTNLNTSLLALEAGGNLAAIAASASVLDDWDETNRAAVNIIAGQIGVAGGTGVDAATVQRVSLATNVALPAGTNAIGKLAANSGVDIGDVDITSIAAGTNAIGRVGHDITGIGNGVTTVTTAGTDVALAASTPCKSVIITAQTDNTNIIAVGATGVDATIATGTGVPLSPGDSVCIEIDNLADIFIDSLVNGEGVRYMYFT